MFLNVFGGYIEGTASVVSATENSVAVDGIADGYVYVGHAEVLSGSGSLSWSWSWIMLGLGLLQPQATL
jgi:hypothetical protein